ncbi:MAG: hypothetical protein H6718_11680 [Polyangiaceae bacterium]|nr:hypothetical protein [Myxococcales bacterium]MCB9586051.1 hypothetical protein [Polyangiaceae bacterium]MCB9608933.1 hypothetical protein [Polyangiaceae bacterium]
MSDQLSKRQSQLKAIDELVQEIGGLEDLASLEDSVRLGKLVVDRLYGGEIAEWRRRDGANVSFRTLTGRKDLKLSAVTLYRAVGLYELTVRLGELTQWPDLGAAHFRAVMGMSQDEQRRLLEAAQAQHWSVRRMEAECSRMRPGRRRGRRRLPGFVKVVRQMDRVASGQLAETKGVEELESVEVQALYDVVVRLKQQLENVEAKLRPRAAVVNMVRRPSGIFESVGGEVAPDSSSEAVG